MKRFAATPCNKAPRQSALPAIAIALVGLGGSGCGNNAADQVTIHGTISFDGPPLSAGQVIFIPADPAIRAAGATITNGVFSITTYRGPHRVEVHAHREQSRPIPPGAPPEAGVEFVSIIPPRYNDQSVLTFDVQSPQDRAEFALTSEN